MRFNDRGSTCEGGWERETRWERKREKCRQIVVGLMEESE